MEKAKVYFLKLNDIGKIKDLLPQFNDKLGIKVHFGEPGNDAFISAKLIKKIAAMVNNHPLVETSVLYKSKRRQANTHREVALEHGFDFAPIDFLDGEEGDDSLVVFIDKYKHNRSCYLGEGLQKYQSLLLVSHFKGHGSAGFGGAIKNVGMGLASRRGKLALHASIKHKVTKDECIGCSKCIENCPVDAIQLDDNKKAVIDQKVCISCSKCISVCPEGAIHIPWSSTGNNVLGERIAEYALAASKKRQCFYINFLTNIVPKCDCIGIKQERMTDDIGILLSTDPVAIDQASYDAVCKQCEDFKKFDGKAQLEHGQEIGLGTREYELINK